MTFTVEAFNAATGRSVRVSKKDMRQAEWLFDYLNERGWVAYNIKVGK